MSQTQQATINNRLLRALTPDDFARLQPHLEPMTSQLREELIGAGEPIKELYFPETGFASIVIDGLAQKIEVGLIGREGLVGAAPLLLGTDSTPQRSFVQMSGTLMRIDASVLRAAALESASLHTILLRYIHTHMIQASLTIYAHAALNLEARLARWLLMCHDRVDGDELVLTHEFLSMMLGVHRAGVTLALQNLEGAGRIKGRRKRIQILDRDKLLQLVDGSYGVAEAEYARLIGGA
ncbi:Crp/Fnr family transcriptional regulator [Methylobacterium terricola]|uniref:Crp/Fnr family transcriptional regulator n=1 Tax=Methylobacterium terricola TaxID=2583531 RepID=A0A5C4L8N2_9HYPH|nr:Crp/Fnr family transcriptional regulator [Methylobacterium terricola]TNC08756.1 Crp/Fnr family transcriptional regulator [Methylobacterium terricola]